MGDTDPSARVVEFLIGTGVALCAIVLSIAAYAFLRDAPADARTLAEQSIDAALYAQVENLTTRQFPHLPEENRREVVLRKVEEYKQANRPMYDAAVEQLSGEIIAQGITSDDTLPRLLWLMLLPASLIVIGASVAFPSRRQWVWYGIAALAIPYLFGAYVYVVMM